MKITGDNPTVGMNIYKRKAEAAKAKNELAGQAANDSVEFSNLSRDLAKVSERMISAGAVREDLVNSLKAKIESGEYKVDSEALSEKIFKEFSS